MCLNFFVFKILSKEYIGLIILGADSYTQFSATGVSPRSLASERPSQSLSKVDSAVIDHSSSSVINGSSVDQKSVSYQNSNVITEADENYEEDDFESLA